MNNESDNISQEFPIHPNRPTRILVTHKKKYYFSHWISLLFQTDEVHKHKYPPLIILKLCQHDLKTVSPYTTRIFSLSWFPKYPTLHGWTAGVIRRYRTVSRQKKHLLDGPPGAPKITRASSLARRLAAVRRLRHTRYALPHERPDG